MGDILGASSDLLSQVLQGDRERTGRGSTPDKPGGQPVAGTHRIGEENTTSSIVGSATGSETTGPTKRKVPEPLEKPEQTRRKSTPRKAPPALAETAEPMDPLEAAIREKLAMHYTGNLSKGPFTVTSMKLQTEVSERLGWASTLLKRPKQDIVSEALRLYFERILREG